MILYLVFLFLAIYNAGCMTVLQLQHYSIYPLVGREQFARYIAANNRAAAIPSVIPGMLLMLMSVVILIRRPPFIGTAEAVAFVALNVIALISTFVWQRPLQSTMASLGYDEAKVRRLIATNWIRTSAFLLNALLATAALVNLR